MRRTVSDHIRAGRTALADDPVTERALLQMEARLNDYGQIVRTVSTVPGGGALKLWTDSVPMPPSSLAEMQAKIIGNNFVTGDYFSHELTGLFHRGTTGSAGQLGGTQEKRPVVRSLAGFVASIGVDGDSKLFVQVTAGAFAAGFNWIAWIEERRT